MQYRIEDIIKYVNSHQDQYAFEIREYASLYGEYSNEVVVWTEGNYHYVGVIIERNFFNPDIYYREQEMLEMLKSLQSKAITWLKN